MALFLSESLDSSESIEGLALDEAVLLLIESTTQLSELTQDLLQADFIIHEQTRSLSESEIQAAYNTMLFENDVEISNHPLIAFEPGKLGFFTKLRDFINKLILVVKSVITSISIKVKKLIIDIRKRQTISIDIVKFNKLRDAIAVCVIYADYVLNDGNNITAGGAFEFTPGSANEFGKGLAGLEKGFAAAVTAFEETTPSSTSEEIASNVLIDMLAQFSKLKTVYDYMGKRLNLVTKKDGHLELVKDYETDVRNELIAYLQVYTKAVQTGLKQQTIVINLINKTLRDSPAVKV